MSTYTPLTAAQVKQISTCISYGIDMDDLRRRVRAVWPEAKSVELHASVEYNDGESYYWSLSDMTVYHEGGEITSSTPGAAMAYEDAIRDISRSIRFGGAADPEDDCSDIIALDLDYPTLNQLYSCQPTAN